jgi:hypothetical protein
MDDFPLTAAAASSTRNGTTTRPGAAMGEFLGALAFTILVAGYLLAVMFVRHDARAFDESSSPQSDARTATPPPERPERARGHVRSA